ncbi:MAG: 4-hydroxythreonine-4-phosphate dehydrogenase PdxA [Turneriella sp.]|nr:4-hydroxythreonine-4-phosphate dehydrogenase PdxA [Turneriella sp.]
MPEPKNLQPVIVSQGDAAGAGWHAFKELIAAQKKFFPAKQDVSPVRRLVVVGDIFDTEAAFLDKHFHVTDYSPKVTALDALLADKKIKKPVFLAVARGKNLEPGKGNSLIALRSYHAFQKAMKLFQEHGSSSLVTLPVSKELIMKAGMSFTGHTEELAAAFQKKVFMCMYHKKFSVVPLTNHIPLAQVSRKLYEVSLEDLASTLQQFTAIFQPKHKIAWCGVNPHCGENGRIGNEEEFVRRGIDLLAKKGVPVDGPISADAVFTKHVLGYYSLVLANYHDQGLIPFKSLAGMAGVNTTLGLPRLRVSPDHGTAFAQTAAKRVDVTGVLASLRFALGYAEKWQQASRQH